MIDEELEFIEKLVLKAGDILLKYFKQEFAIDFKSDKYDPVTTADKQSDEFLRSAISQKFPADQILSEENSKQPESYTGRVWMIDPLDGTKDFIVGRDCFSIVIGLLDKGKPVLGVVYLPVRKQLYFARIGKGAYLKEDGKVMKLKVSKIAKIKDGRLLTHWPSGEKRPLVEFTDKIPFKEKIPEGSVGTKMAMIASGQAEVYIQTSPRACKWDTLGSQVILTEAGGVITDSEGNNLDYTKAKSNWYKYFIASNNEKMHSQVTELLNKDRLTA